MKAEERKLARELRKQGWSLRAISKQTGCSKASISNWIRDIPLTDEQIARLKSNQDKGRAAAAKHPNGPKMKWEKIRSTIITAAKEEVPLEYSLESLKYVGAALYWGEGYKVGNSSVVFSNSDPGMIRFMMLFFREVCKVPEDKFRGGINIHPHLDANEAVKYWSGISGIPLDLFHKPTLAVSRASKGKKDSLPLGTFRIVVSDVYIRSKIKGWIEGLKKWAEIRALSSVG